MKLLKITFTTPRHVLGETVGLLSTEQNQASRQVDSITADGFWVIVTRGERTAIVPATSIEEAVPLAAAPAKSSGSKPR